VSCLQQCNIIGVCEVNRAQTSIITWQKQKCELGMLVFF